ncbi:MAG TPA: peptide deformylase [Thermoanaerobaculia bacterium]|jgi:peptide deformylase|nr:peptide deformylase [Thermoanaerobaculia bacterium]
MPLRPIVRLGHPALRTPAFPIPPERIGEPELQALIDDMIETMHEARGVGLAAPQVGEEVQVFVYQAAGPPEIPLHVVVNPMITPQARELAYDWEGCLSIPDLRGLVPRHPKVRVQGLDREGRPLDYGVSGFEARIVQHEFDHLNGIVFLDRMRDLRSLAFFDEWEAYLVGGSQPDLDETAVG